MMLRQAREQDLDRICELYEQLSEQMEKQGLHQWHWGDYPNREMVAEDISRGEMYCYASEDGVSLAVTVKTDEDEAYDTVNWLFGTRPGSFYRLAVHQNRQTEGYGMQIVTDVEEILRQRGCELRELVEAVHVHVDEGKVRGVGHQDALHHMAHGQEREVADVAVAGFPIEDAGHGHAHPQQLVLVEHHALGFASRA